MTTTTSQALTIPARIAALRLDPKRGVPVPWFVAWIDGQPDFRVIDVGKFRDAIRFKQCWVCGQEVGRNLSFLIGPMCAISRTTSEPPCHDECATYSARACPFLAHPRQRRRENNLPEHDASAGLGSKLNPGVALVWTTRSYKIFPDHNQRPLISVGPPENVQWFAEGRVATRAEVEESIRTGVPLLDAECDRDKNPATSRAALAEATRAIEALLPAPP